ncbi:MAG: hypothetical protein MRQ13_05780 [Candidatus Midichloria sp.]|nr:hypothetical protein [Candidatus Midichloria sp.]
MPCVLPVLSLKIFGIIRSKKFANTKTELLFTIAGIISTLAVLSIIVSGIFKKFRTFGWLAFAITKKKSYAIFIIYSSIGFSMTLPYILMIIAPNILKIFPKPGACMLKLQLIAAILYLTY